MNRRHFLKAIAATGALFGMRAAAGQGVVVTTPPPAPAPPPAYVPAALLSRPEYLGILSFAGLNRGDLAGLSTAPPAGIDPFDPLTFYVARCLDGSPMPIIATPWCVVAYPDVRGGRYAAHREVRRRDGLDVVSVALSPIR
jgi:hypothetical protein